MLAARKSDTRIVALGLHADGAIERDAKTSGRRPATRGAKVVVVGRPLVAGAVRVVPTLAPRALHEITAVVPRVLAYGAWDVLLHRLHGSGARQGQRRLEPDACRPTTHNSPKTLPCAARAARCATSRRGAPAPRSRRSFGLTKDCSCKLRSENPATVARREGGVSTARVPKRSGGLWAALSGSARTPRAARWSRARGRTSTRPRVCRMDDERLQGPKEASRDRARRSHPCETDGQRRTKEGGDQS